MNESYVVLAVIVFGMNVVPAFMPPTWIILAFFYLHYKLALLPVVIIGALAATCGRIVLANLARHYFRPFFSKKSQENFGVLGEYFNTHRHISVPLVILYAFLPIPSNQVYITAGLAKANIRILAFSFLVGRLISYTGWISAAHFASRNLEGIFGEHLTRGGNILLELLGFGAIYLISKIDWVRIIKDHQRKRR